MFATVPRTKYVLNKCYWEERLKGEAGSQSSLECLMCCRDMKKGILEGMGSSSSLRRPPLPLPPPLMRCASTWGIDAALRAPDMEMKFLTYFSICTCINVLGLWVTLNYSGAFWTMPVMEWVLWNSAFKGDIIWKLSATRPQRYQAKRIVETSANNLSFLKIKSEKVIKLRKKQFTFAICICNKKCLVWHPHMQELRG